MLVHVSVPVSTPLEAELEPDAMVITTLFAVVEVILKSYQRFRLSNGEVASKRGGDPMPFWEFRVINTFEVVVA